MDQKSCVSIAKSEKHIKTLVLYHAFKVVVENIASDDMVKSQRWIPCLSSFEVNNILWSQHSVKLILILASVVSPHPVTPEIKYYFIMVKFLRDLMDTAVYSHLSKYLHDHSSDLGVLEWRAVRNLCSIVNLPISAERGVIKAAQNVIVEITYAHKVSDWRNMISSVEICLLECALLSQLAIVKNNPSSASLVCKSSLAAVVAVVALLHHHPLDSASTPLVRRGSRLAQEEEVELGGAGAVSSDEESVFSGKETNSQRGPSKAKSRVAVVVQRTLDAWVSHVSNAAVLLIVACTRQEVAHISSIKQCDIVSLMQASNWHLQAIALVLLRLQFEVCQVHLQQQQTKKSGHETQHKSQQRGKFTSKFASKLSRDNSSGRGHSSGRIGAAGGSASTDSGSKAQLLRSSTLPTGGGEMASDFVSFCRNGYLRVLLWYLLHSSALLRDLAMKAVSVACSLFDSAATDLLGSTFTEQGLVPLLEFIACGVPVSLRRQLDRSATPVASAAAVSVETSFPEMAIREWANTVLIKLVSQYTTNKASLDGLAISLMHSGSSRLRLNVLASVLYLASHSRELSCSLVSLDYSADGKLVDQPASSTFFRRLFSQVMTSQADLNSLLMMLFHCLNEGHFLIGRIQQQKEQGQSTQLKLNWRIPGLPTDALSRSNAVILVRDTASRQEIKMTCPAMHVIEFHSLQLAELISKGSSGDGGTGMAQLGGSYVAWEEIFSHMVDQYICDTRLPHVATPLLLAMYKLTCRFDMATMESRYTAEIVKRISTKSIHEIFAAIVPNESPLDSSVSGGETVPLRRLSLLTLSSQCVLYCLQHSDYITNGRRDARQNLIMTDALTHLFHMCIET